MVFSPKVGNPDSYRDSKVELGKTIKYSGEGGKKMFSKVYTFHLDGNMDIDKSTPEEQIENLKGFIAQIQKEKQLISEIRQMKIENIEKKP